MFTTACFSIRPVTFHTHTSKPPPCCFSTTDLYKKERKKTPPDVWRLIIWFIYLLISAGGAQSENRALYFTKNSDYVITGLLTFTPTKSDSDGWDTKNLSLCATWRTRSEFWACCMGARECALSRKRAVFFSSIKLKDIQGKMRNIFQSLGKTGFIVSWEVSSLSRHSGSHKQTDGFKSPLVFLILGVWWCCIKKKSTNLKPCCINFTSMFRSKLKL